MARRAQQRIPTEQVPRGAAGSRGEPSASELAMPEPARLVGQVLEGRYRIESAIAGGAMGHVYRATQLPFERDVAVKVLYCDDDDETNHRFRKRFEREASIAAQITHPNIVTIIDYGETKDGDMFMAMEYLDGKPLYRVLQEQGPFTARRAMHIAIQVVRALRRAHRMGVVHRDLKPANIMVRVDEDEGDFVKVLDFGLVKVFEPESEVVPDGITDEHLTSAGAMMGTPGYMSPEQAVGERVDGRADLYSLAVIVFQMLTGKLPFEGDSIVDLITAQVMRPVPFVREVEPDADCPEALEAIIHRCLNKSRDERYESAEQLLVAFKEAWRHETDQSMGTEASLARPLLAPETVRVRAMGPAPTPIDDPSLPTVPVEGAAHELDAEPAADTTAAPRPRKIRWWPLVAVGLLVFAAGAAAVTFFVQPRLRRSEAAVGGLVDLPEPTGDLELPLGDAPPTPAAAESDPAPSEPAAVAPAPLPKKVAPKKAAPKKAAPKKAAPKKAAPKKKAPPRRRAPAAPSGPKPGSEGYKDNPF